ncbi:MAG TPA: glycosyltransferase family 4 protein [Edaphobacter sp.]|nr:glycosyltransferase family 4 protein [Edaphobacter sp.]
MHIISSGGMYGAEAVILNLSRVLNEGGHACVLGVFSNSSKPNLQLHERALEEGLESNLIPCSGQIDRTVGSSIRELVARTEADVVHAHGYKADVYVYRALRGTETPFVSTCHNWLKGNLMVSLYGAVDRFVLRNYDGVVAVSEEVRARLRKSGVCSDKIHLIQNGIDLRPFAKATPSLRTASERENSLLVGWIGRLSKEKGVDIFLRASKQVLARLSSTRFVIVGDGPDLDKTNSLIDELGIRSNVSLAGRRENMASVYASLDLMVSSSRQEGLPMAILEGMASGLPLVATAVGDVPMVVIDGSTGAVVRSEDVKLLADAMIQLLQDGKLRDCFGTAGKRLVKEQFSAERMATNYMDVYSEVITAKKKARRDGRNIFVASRDGKQGKRTAK